MIATNTNDPEFTSTESGTLQEYQPLNRIAAASLIVGLLSIVSLVHPVLWAIPAVTVVLTLLALRQIERSGGEQRGTVMAKTGLAIGLLFGSFAISWYLTDYVLLSRQARVYGDAWVELLRQGRIYEAHQLMLPVSQRAKRGESLVSLYNQTITDPPPPPSLASNKPSPKPPSPEEMTRRSLPMLYKQFIHDFPISKLVTLGKSWEIEFVRTRSQSRGNQTVNYVSQDYDVRYTEHDQPQTLRIVIELMRTRAGNEAHWQVNRVSVPDRGKAIP